MAIWAPQASARWRLTLTAIVGSALALALAAAAATDPFADVAPAPARSADPFLTVTPATAPGRPENAPPAVPTGNGALDRFLSDNFTLKLEWMSQFAATDDAEDTEDVYSRQSAGFEVLKRFSTRTSTLASVNLQGRFVRRDHFLPVINDMEGEDREGWYGELHNAYIDVYNVFSPFLDDAAKGANIGRFNLRVGRFYLPFGLNLQTDTHGTLLQLSNDRNFGYERDWYAGFWGALNEHVNYDLYGMLGTGYDLAFRGQDGLVGGRLSLGGRYLQEYGLEGGFSAMVGERVSPHAWERSLSVREEAAEDEIIDTVRCGPDLRYTRMVPSGTLTGSTELSAGRDEADAVLTQLYQLEYLNRSRRWGAAVQYRRFWQDFARNEDSRKATGKSPMGMDGDGDAADSSLIGEVTWYFRNDIGNTTLHWLKLNVEQQVERQYGDTATVISVQYYRYW